MERTKAKTIVANMGWLSLIQMASYVFPLITMPYLARVIGVVGFGKIAFASAIVVWFQTITDWGFNFSGARDVARNSESNSKLSEIYSNIFWSRLLLMLICLLVLLLLIGVIPKFNENKTVILLTFLMILGNIFCPDWFFQGVQKMKFMTISNVLSKLFFTCAVFIFIRSADDYILQPLLISIGYIVSGIFATYIIVCRWKIRIQKPILRNLFTTIKSSKDIFLNNLLPNFYNSFSIIILGFFYGSSSNGKLDAGSKFVSIGQQVNHIISRAFYPLLAKELKYHNVFRYFNLGVAFVGSLALWMLSPWLIHTFFTSAFEDSILICRILSFSIFFMALNGTYGTNYLILNGHESLLRRVTMYCSIVGMISSVPLIYYLNYVGAALTITLTRAILGITVFLTARRNRRYEDCNS